MEMALGAVLTSASCGRPRLVDLALLGFVFVLQCPLLRSGIPGRLAISVELVAFSFILILSLQ